MALYEFAASTRKLIVYSLIGSVILAISWIALSLALGLYNQLNPSSGPPPTTGFGKLPPLRLLSLAIEGNPTFALETATGDLPQLEKQVPVVAMKVIQPTLLGEEKTRQLAASFDFGGQGTLTGDKEYLVFLDEIDQRALAVHIPTQTFALTTDLERIAATPKGTAPSGPDGVKRAQDFLQRLGLLKFGFEEGNQETSLRAIQGNESGKVESLSEAQFTEVNFFRSLTDISSKSYPILPPEPHTGLIQIWLTTGSRPDINNFLRISYTNWEIDKTKVETYPLRSVQTAWDTVKEGKGAAYLGVSGELRTITVTEVTLAYFDDLIFQDYLQPIYVFSGIAANSTGAEGEFIAYVQAVTDEWIK